MIEQKPHNTKIYILFFTSGFSPFSRGYTIDHPDMKVMENREILEKLKKKCKDVDFVGSSDPTEVDEAIANVEERKNELDGVLVFGCPPEEILTFDLPVISVFPLWGMFMDNFNPYKERKVVTSILPVVPDKDSFLYSARIEEIAKKIKLINAISKMRQLRVLIVTDLPTLGSFQPMDYQYDKSREEYEKIYLDNLQEILRTDLVTVPQKELLERMKMMNQEKANEIAQKWIDEAMAIRGTNKTEVLKSARLYLAMKDLLDKYNCNAIATEGYGWPDFEVKSDALEVIDLIDTGSVEFPSQGLPSSQFLTDGIVATSETLVDSLITQQLGLYITGTPGFNGDYMIDPFHDVAIVGHCECPFNPYGDKRKVPYTIRNLPVMKKNEGGACVQVDCPIGETVTVAKVSIHQKKISVFEGETVSGENLFPYWNDILCRTKIAIKTDVKNLLKNLDWKTFGGHRVVFYGDYRQEFVDLSKLIGFDIVEDDQQPAR